MLLQGLNEQRCGGNLSSGEDKQRMESFDGREALSGGVAPAMWWRCVRECTAGGSRQLNDERSGRQEGPRHHMSDTVAQNPTPW